MAINTTGNNGSVVGVTGVHPDNIGKGIKWNETTKKYEVAISNQAYNMISLRDDGLYYGSAPTRTSFYVDYLNGSDNNDGSKAFPFKTVGKALRSVETGTVGTYIFLKENQKHYFSADVTDDWSFAVNASYTIYAYGDMYDALYKDWYSMHLGYSTPEPLEASQAYKALQPTLVFRGTTLPLPNDEHQRTFMENITIMKGTIVTVNGIKFVCENTTNVANSAGGWFSTCFRGSGEVILNSCTMVQRDFEHGHFYLANSTIGQLTVSLRYFIIGGTGYLFKVGQYPLNVFSSYDTVTDESVNDRSLTQMKYKGVASASQIFALTTDNNPKSFITNK